MPFTVFLVEDEPKLLEMIGEAVSAVCDAEVVGTAETEADAVEWLNSHRGQWRLAVLDLFLKTGTGFGVLNQLGSRSAREQVIVLTNSATQQNRDRCLEMGALAVYDKTAEFEQFLDHCLRHHQQAQGT